VENIKEYEKQYDYDNRKNIFWHKKDTGKEKVMRDWFTLD